MWSWPVLYIAVASQPSLSGVSSFNLSVVTDGWCAEGQTNNDYYLESICAFLNSLAPLRTWGLLLQLVTLYDYHTIALVQRTGTHGRRAFWHLPSHG